MTDAAQSPPPTDHDPSPGYTLNRREFAKAIGAAAAIGAGATASSGTASAASGSGGFGTNGAMLLLSPSAYVAYQVATDTDGKSDQVIHEEMYTTAREMMEDRQNAFDSIEGNVRMLSGWVRDNATNEMANVAATDGTLSEMHTAVEERIRGDVAKVEQNLFNLWVTDFEETAKAIYTVDQSSYTPDPHMFLGGTVGLNGGVSSGSLESNWNWLNTYQSWGYYHAPDQYSEPTSAADIIKEVTFPLANGDSITMPVGGYISDTRGTSLFPFAEIENAEWTSDRSNETTVQHDMATWWEDAYMMSHPGEFSLSEFQDAGYSITEDYGDFDVRLSIYPWDATTGDRAELLDAQKFTAVHKELLELLEEELSWAETAVENFGQALLDGEIDAHDVASGQAVLDEASSMEDWNDAAMYFRAVNWPEGEHSAVVELENGLELQGALFWTAPDEENGMPVGEWLDPTSDNLLGEVHMGAEVKSLPDDSDGTDGNVTDGNETVDSGDLDGVGEDFVSPIELTEPFKITGLEDGASGPLMFDSTELPEPQDTEAMQQRIQDAYDREQEAKEEAGDVNVDASVSVPSVPNPLDGEGGAWIGLGIIGAVVMIVIGYVTDLIPGLGK